MNDEYLDRIGLADCREHLPLLSDDSIELLLSDIPYGIGLDDWDVLHNNTNTALLGRSPAQIGKSGFRRRGKPINGWSQADRVIGQEYEDWCRSWATMAFPKLKSGASLFIFGARRTLHRAIIALESAGFLLKDTLAWKKEAAHHRAQRVSVVFRRRGQESAAKTWEGWRVGNLAPIYEPIAWFMKPYRIGGTIADNVLEHGVGAMNVEECRTLGAPPTNLLEFGFRKHEPRIHEAQKPLQLMEYLIRLTTREGQTVLDPFIGSGTTAVAAKRLMRHFIGFEQVPKYHSAALHRLESEAETDYPSGSQLQARLFERRKRSYRA